MRLKEEKGNYLKERNQGNMGLRFIKRMKSLSERFRINGPVLVKKSLVFLFELHQIVLFTKSSWIQDRTIGNFSGACFSAKRSNVVRNVRHFDTKSLIWDSVYTVAFGWDVTVWRTTGWVITFVGITDDCGWTPLSTPGSKEKQHAFSSPRSETLLNHS